MKTSILFFAVLFLNIGLYAQSKAELENSCLSKFKDLSLPLKMEASGHQISSPTQGTLTAKEQEILGMGGYNEEGFGLHMGTVGKVKLNTNTYLLIYSTQVVPVPAHMDEYSFAIYKKGSYKLESINEIAYTRGGPGIDEGTMTCEVSKKGKNIEIALQLKFKKAIETNDGPDFGPLEVFKWVHSVDSNGKVKLGKKVKTK